QLLIVCLLWLHYAYANVEKLIFLAPPAESLPTDASIDNLLLTPLSEGLPSVRTHINASFANKESPKGTETWLLLEGLRPHRRYEVRVCWLATQPTSFWLYTHTVEQTFSNPGLLTSLSTYAYSRHEQLLAGDIQELQLRKSSPDSVGTESTFLFLQVFAAADYFSLNRTLMETVPPVAVDIILDPYFLNVLPKSLLPTGLYLLIIACGAWFISGQVARLFTGLNAAQEKDFLRKSE
ncbi:hypothetical protein A1O3_00697, partial [Capronia epimyces CBS 606.96]